MILLRKVVRKSLFSHHKKSIDGLQMKHLFPKLLYNKAVLKADFARAALTSSPPVRS
ncbi:hypothetical protein ACIAD2130 [Acinetobacter baylyi ADP1]|uniref:Uncharacterized protein n=1 Tax=Acinetobacter baylyi (strain ATCC 33305 / BD413 / ADP1) TaxID=62977 RepID=Q6FAH8_ACIAD|nr:hypothetical protein ACIAD2130 [Acinetobacter baylyi ADP1]